jgi:hypothetical protein
MEKVLPMWAASVENVCSFLQSVGLGLHSHILLVEINLKKFHLD